MCEVPIEVFRPVHKRRQYGLCRVNAILSKTNDELKDQYYPNHSGQFMHDMQWECGKKNFDALLLAISTLDAKAELKTMSKDSKVSLLQFICCFQATM